MVWMVTTVPGLIDLFLFCVLKARTAVTSSSRESARYAMTIYVTDESWFLSSCLTWGAFICNSVRPMRAWPGRWAGAEAVGCRQRAGFEPAYLCLGAVWPLRTAAFRPMAAVAGRRALGTADDAAILSRPPDDARPGCGD